MELTVSRVAKDLEIMFPEVKGNIAFETLRVMAKTRAIGNQRIEVQMLSKDYDAYVAAHTGVGMAILAQAAQQSQTASPTPACNEATLTAPPITTPAEETTPMPDTTPEPTPTPKVETAAEKIARLVREDNEKQPAKVEPEEKREVSNVEKLHTQGLIVEAVKPVKQDKVAAMAALLLAKAKQGGK